MTHPDLINPVQSLTLGLGRDAAATTAKTLVGEVQIGCLLEDVIAKASQTGLIDDILVAGQSVMCSDLSADIKMFDPTAYCEGHRGLGIPFNKTQKVTIKATLDANGTFVAAVNVQNLPAEVRNAGIPDVNSLGPRLHYLFGLGKKVVPAAAPSTAIITATASRDVRLGLLSMSAADATILDLTVQSIKHNNKEFLTGRNDSTIDEVPLATFDFRNTDVDGRILAADVKTNDKLTMTLKNFNVGDLTVWGGIFCMPVDDAPGEAGE